MLRKLFGDRNYLQKFILTIEGEEDGGGVESGAGAGSSGEGAEHQQEGAQGSGAAEDANRQGDPNAAGRRDEGRRQSEWIPKQRFDHVNRGYQAYKRFGSPVEIEQKLKMLETLQQKPENRYDANAQREIREDFLRIFPEMRAVVNAHQTQNSSFLSSGVRQNDTFLKELGIEVNETNNQLLQDAIGGIIARDPELNERFYARDSTVFADGFRQFKKLMNIQQKRTVPGLYMARNKSVPKAPQSKSNGGGAPPKSKATPGSSLYERELLDEAGEAAFARLSDQME